MKDMIQLKPRRKRHEVYRVGSVVVEKRPIDCQYGRPKESSKDNLKTS